MENIGNNLIFKCKTRKMGFLYAPKHKHMTDSCGCQASKRSNSRDQRLVSSLPIPYCANSVWYVDFIHGMPRFDG